MVSGFLEGGGSWRSLGHRAQGQQSTSAEKPEGKLGQRQVSLGEADRTSLHSPAQ